jgi:hypothetical protein
MIHRHPIFLAVRSIAAPERKRSVPDGCRMFMYTTFKEQPLQTPGIIALIKHDTSALSNPDRDPQPMRFSAAGSGYPKKGLTAQKMRSYNNGI